MKLLIYYIIILTNIALSLYKTKLNQFYDTRTNYEIRSNLIKEIIRRD
jgi:hypothetical protein